MKVCSAQKILPITVEIIIRVFLFVIFWSCEGEDAVPCERTIRPEELWLYKYPRHDSYVPTWALWLEVFTVGPLVILIAYITMRDRHDVYAAFMSYSLACLVNGVFVNTIKLAAGRPRPDFYFRCYPNGEDLPWISDAECTGLRADVVEGRKSFPSGHSSWSFTIMTWVFLYASGKLHAFTKHGEGEGSWRFVLCISPLLMATCIAISRTCDNHHHWQDVTVGSILGVCASVLVYFRYYPSLSNEKCHFSLYSVKHGDTHHRHRTISSSYSLKYADPVKSV